MKIQKISQTITPFAGISFVPEAFNRCSFSKLIDNRFNIRSVSDYWYSEIFRGWFSIFLCGGDVAEYIQIHLHPTLESIPDNCLPSADTLLRGIKELATDNDTAISSSGKEYRFNIKTDMNYLNIKLLILIK